MNELDAIKTLLDLGGQGVLLVLLWQVWKRLNIITDIMIAERARSAMERQAIANQVGAQLPIMPTTTEIKPP